jgi:hypothetical protein
VGVGNVSNTIDLLEFTYKQRRQSVPLNRL